MPPARSSNKNKYIAAFLLLLLISMSAYAYLMPTKAPAIETGTILVLPVQLATGSTDSQWNPYAAMDVLINQLNVGVSYPLLQTEDIINIISLISNDHLSQAVDIKQLMAVSGAGLVIESRITSANNQYQLAFTLHQQHHTEAGVVNASSIEQAILATSSLITQQLNPQHNPQHNKTATQYHSRYSTPLLFSAMTQLQLDDTKAAEQHLSKLIHSTPDNLVAMRLLASIQLQQHQYEQLNTTLIAAIDQATHQQDERELARLRLLLAQSYTETDRIEQALGVLTIAKTNAAKVKDWLTLGYISRLAGMINQRIGRNDKAREQFKKAIEYHQMMNYPIGQTQALNELAELEVIEFNYPQAYRYINRSYEQVAHRGLDNLEKSTFKIMTKIENKMQHR
ncbi:MAG: tetratricopeptide (TPR) repeat protein [Shewanella psychromarinicola]|jgi:tetratricopeptide (TPR) repeat protein|uniref:tetratricopeptide repeat protein n=1 Tax=Shewanella psychromarinicola TaxID=2487742 RepID=UPI003EEA1AEB